MKDVSYKETIFLPKTDFPMRGDLVKREPARLATWEKEGLFERIVKRRREAGAPRFVLHDGPPFANGDVHMGTALNKVLKDFVVKSKTMAGYEVPFVPGWDCHGLPIEFKVMQDARGEEPAEIRRRCESFAKKWIETQKASFRRLGVLGDWENPYLTLDPAYEAEVLRIFARLIEQGRIYQSQKPVQWSYGAQTALAEAEVEYADKVSDAVYVSFALVGERFSGASIVIWTTTPWTLPANLGVAVHEREVYMLGEFTHPEHDKPQSLIVAVKLLEAFEAQTGWKLVKPIEEVKGSSLEGLVLQHPFLEREVPIILAAFVTTENGTGAVHIAPGHGADDYAVGQQNGLGLLSPVDDEGLFTDECGLPELIGVHVFKSNKRIIELLGEQGVLLGKERYEHSYPHCWRSKTPIIFRAVKQFFISLEELRDKALEEIDQVEWLPQWGRNRIYGTVEARPDWCISRQRTWGVPLPVFFDENGEAILDAEVVKGVAEVIKEEGSNAWFEKSAEDWARLLGLPSGVKKGTDTLDVWIDSGSSHVAVMERRDDVGVPADLYIEATDQHRGWFQSSLMLSTAWRDKAPYKAVMTHGFVVDQDTGKKTSKSDAKTGKPTDAAHFYQKYGADIVRLWVASVDWQTEVPFGENLFKQVTEPYRRLRNTFRILLGNREGFDPQSVQVSKSEMPLLDRWILEQRNLLIERCLNAYEEYDFRKVFSLVNQFCANELSSLYIDMTKDRLYCDGGTEPRRLATQMVMHSVFETLVKLMAPILVFTADEAWEYAGNEGSVHEEDFPAVDPAFSGDDATQKVNELLKVRELIQQAIEEQVKQKAFNKNNEAYVYLTVPKESLIREVLENREEAVEFFIISDLEIKEGPSYAVEVRKTNHEMCPRCRRYEPAVDDAKHCLRCQQVLEEMKSA